MTVEVKKRDLRKTLQEVKLLFQKVGRKKKSIADDANERHWKKIRRVFKHYNYVRKRVKKIKKSIGTAEHLSSLIASLPDIEDFLFHEIDTLKLSLRGQGESIKS